MSDANLHPIFDRVLGRREKEKALAQRACVVWFFGLSGSGKSTLAVALERRLYAEGFATHLLDGDNLRTGLNRGLGFSDVDRAENLRRAAETARLFTQAGVIVLASFITPTRALRASVRAIVGEEDFVPVFANATFETCAKRDPKGLYAKAGAGGVAQFTGRDSQFEPPAEGEPVQVIDTERQPVEQAVDALFALLLPRITYS